MRRLGHLAVVYSRWGILCAAGLLARCAEAVSRRAGSAARKETRRAQAPSGNALARTLLVLAAVAAGCVPPAAVSRWGEVLPDVGSPPAPRAPAPAARVLSEAERILAAAQGTAYTHRTRMDEAAGLYETDCSGLVGYILKRVVPEHWAVLVAEAGRRRPRAVEFYEFFKARAAAGAEGRGWRGIERLADARPGDIIAWRRTEVAPGGDTGHVVILASVPAAEAGGVFRVVVIDSTGLRHDADSRPAGTSGVGRGTMWLRVDEGGRPVGFRRNARVDFRAVPVAIGRPVEPSSRLGM